MCSSVPYTVHVYATKHRCVLEFIAFIQFIALGVIDTTWAGIDSSFLPLSLADFKFGVRKLFDHKTLELVVRTGVSSCRSPFVAVMLW